MQEFDVGEWVRLMNDASERVRAKAAIEVLGIDLPKVREQLAITITTDLSEYVSCLAVHAARFTKDSAGLLCPAISRAKPKVKLCILKALSAGRVNVCTGEIRDLLQHETWFVRLEAAITLISLGVVDEYLVDVLCELQSSLTKMDFEAQSHSKGFVPDGMLLRPSRAKRRLSHYLARAKRTLKPVDT